MRVEVTCRACAGQEKSSAPAASRPARSADRRDQSTARLPQGQRATSRTEWLGISLVALAVIASTGIALVVRHRRAAPAAAATTPAAPAAAPRIAAPSGASEDSDFHVPPPVGLEAVLQGKWTHPLPGPYRDLPTHEQRRFGAYRGREHYRNRYCGSGHCGVDLGYNVGLPVLAARDGVIERVVRNPTEVEGKYLKIQHPGGLRSYYMHLNEIAPELVEGSAVKAGQIVGTLGRTGIKIAEPHLHFMISFMANGKELFIDPEPLMAKADLVEVENVPAWAKTN